ncbi:MAG: ACP S-malonyltransferase [Desulfovibrio sp.]|nr:ACP S-malonyltransferase [Desulfovibrio sp.]
MHNPVLLFPGQGSQCLGMGRDLAEAQTFAMEIWKLAERISHKPLREIFWEGDEAAMSDTAVLQPALTVVNCALYELLRGKVEPSASAGHSLGEFSALVAAGVLSLEDALKLTSLRGELMAQADPSHSGGMVAVVKLSGEDVERLVAEAAAETGELLLCANFNAPKQTVVSGHQAALSALQPKVKAAKGRALPLKVSAAFHSPMMAEANREFQPLLKKVTWHDARFPVYSNVYACAERSGERLREAMLEQMVSPVRWLESVRAQYHDGLRAWLEAGPKSLLIRLVTSCLEDYADADLECAAVSDLATAAACTFAE